MLRFLLRKTARVLLTLMAAITLGFILLRALPGDAVTETLLRSGASPTQVAERRTQLGLNDPLWKQYVATVSGYIRGNPGVSLITGRPVTEMIAEQLPATTRLAIGGIMIGALIGISAGIVIVTGHGVSLWFARTLITVTSATPVFITGLIGVQIFSLGLGWLPSISARDDFRSLILPWSVLGLNICGAIARATVGALAAAHGESYPRTARGKGLRERTVMLRHMLRPALPVIITAVGLQAAFLLIGTPVTEVLFARPGLGQVVVTAVNNRDYPVLQAVIAWSALIWCGINLFTTWFSAVLDPRLRNV